MSWRLLPPIMHRPVAMLVVVAEWAVCVLLVVPSPMRQTVDSRPSGLLVAACAGLLLGGLVVAIDDIVDLFRPAGLTPVSRER